MKDDCTVNNDIPDLHICSYPPNKQRRIDIFTVDYLSLAPGVWMNDQLINFYVKYLEDTMSEDSRSQIACLSSNFYNALDREDRLPVDERNSNLLSSWTRKYRLWKRGGVSLIILPVIRSYHWVTVVGVLRPKPIIAVLNSLGSGDKMPKEAGLLRDFLLGERKEVGDDFSIVVPNVPIQPNSNDCGSFTLKFIEKVIENPKEFVQRIENRGELQHWFPIKEAGLMRKKLADLAGGLAKQQGRSSRVPNISFEQVLISSGCFELCILVMRITSLGVTLISYVRYLYQDHC